MAFAACVLLVQCRKPVFPDFDGDGQQTITFTTGGDGSKGDFFQEGEPGDDVYKKLKYKWADGDAVRVYASVSGTFADGTYCGVLKLKPGCVGETVGDFEGWVVRPAGMTNTSKVRFYHFGADVQWENHTANVDFSNQNGNLTGDNSVSSKIVAMYEAGYDSKGKYGGKLSVQLAIAKVNIENFAEDVTVNNVVNTGININDKGEVSYTRGSSMALEYKAGDYYAVFVPDEVNGGAKSYTEKTYTLESVQKIATIKMTVKPNGFYTPNGDGSAAQIASTYKEGFSISESKQVRFAKGNLYWDGSAFKFEANQWDYRHFNGIKDDRAVINGVETTTPEGTVGSFFWNYCSSNACAKNYDDNLNDQTFFTNVDGFQVDGQTGWYTLSRDEWDYLLNSRTPNTTIANYKVLTISGSTATVGGLVILPDNSNSTVLLDAITTTADLATYGAVFLSKMGRRYDSLRGWGDDWVAGVYSFDEFGHYLSCTPADVGDTRAWSMCFDIKNYVLRMELFAKFDGNSVRLVRNVE